jgi:hypothetical protein
MVLAPEISARSWSVIPDAPSEAARRITYPGDRPRWGRYAGRGIVGPTPAGDPFTPLRFLPAIPIAGVSTAPAFVPVLAFISEEPVVPALAEHPVPALATDEPVLAPAPA